MAMRKYERAILDALQGQTDDLRALPPERLDWAGSGALLALYRKTSGSDREALIRAIGQLIEKHPAPPAVIAQLVNLASSLDLAQVEPQVRRLQAEPVAAEEPLKGALTNYLAFRQLNALHEPPTGPRAENGKPKPRRPRSGRAASQGPAPGQPFPRAKSTSA